MVCNAAPTPSPGIRRTSGTNDVTVSSGFVRLGIEVDRESESQFAYFRHLVFLDQPQRLAADGSYGTGPFLSWLVERGVEPHVPVLERKHQTKGKLTRDAFAFDRKRNLFICPTGRAVTYRGAHYAARVHTYRSNAADCATCPMRQGCTSGRVRTVVRLFNEDTRDHARKLRDTPAYAQSCRERKKIKCYSLTSSDT